MKMMRILYDAEVVAHAMTEKNADRSGIYFTAYNLLCQFAASDKVKVGALVPASIGKHFRKAIRRDERLKNLSVLTSGFRIFEPMVRWWKDRRDKKWKKAAAAGLILIILRALSAIEGRVMTPLYERAGRRTISRFDAYFSPAFRIPEFVKKDRRLENFTVLYDAIPALFPEFSYKWFRDLLESMNADEHYFAISEATKRDFLRLAPQLKPENITVAPLAASDNFYRADADAITAARKKYKIPAGKKYVLSMCTLEPRKNLIFAIKNFILFVEKNKADDMVFVLGGGHWKEFIGKLESEIGALGKYRDLIIRAGYVDDADMAALYSGAIAFAYPSLYEGFGLPPLEAMKCGAPVITSNVSSLPEVVGDAGIMIDPADGDAFVRALMRIYSDENFRAELSKKGLSRAKEFSWEKTAEVMLNVICERQNQGARP